MKRPPVVFYKIRRKFWEQRPLKWGETQDLIALFQKHIGQLPVEDNEYAQAFDKIYNSPAFVDVIAIILKESNSNFFKWIWNSIIDLIDGPFTSRSVARELTKGEVWKVLADFFTLRQKWSEGYFDSLRNETSRLKKVSLPILMKLGLAKERSSSLEEIGIAREK